MVQPAADSSADAFPESFFPEICFDTNIGRQCYPIFSTPTIPPGPVLDQGLGLGIGTLSGFDAVERVQFNAAFYLDPITCAQRARFYALDLESSRRFSPLTLEISDNSALHKLAQQPELRQLSKKAVCAPLQLTHAERSEGKTSRDEADGSTVTVLEAYGREDAPNSLFLRSGDRFTCIWNTASSGGSAGLGFTTDDGPVYWIPWAIGGAAVALCIGAAVYTCGSCKAKIWKVEIGYECEN